MHHCFLVQHKNSSSIALLVVNIEKTIFREWAKRTIFASEAKQIHHEHLDRIASLEFLIALWLQINAFSLIIFIAASTIWASYALRSPIYFYNLIIQIKIQWVREAKQIHYHQLDYVFAARFMTFYRKSSLLFLKWYCLNALDLLLPVWWSCFYNDILCLSFDAAQIILLNGSFLNDPGLLSSSINPSQMILLYWSC